MNWLYYLAEANAYLVVIYAIYYVALRRETFYQLNRIYLLVGSALAFIIPLLQVGILRPTENAAVQIVANTETPWVRSAEIAEPTQPIYLLWVYSAIAGSMLLLFIYKLVQLLLLAKKGVNRATKNGFNLIEIDSKDTPAFSFFNYLFISTAVTGADTIIKHELVHIRQKHSWDVVYLELLKIVNWFNPVAYLMQNSMKELHEYIADEQLGQTRQEKNDYTDFLISNAYGAFATSLTNNFFNKNLLKKRIIMLHKQRSGYVARLKYLIIFPVCGGLICSSTLAFSKTYGLVDLMPQHDTLKLVKPAVKVIEIKPTTKKAEPETITIKLTPSIKANQVAIEKAKPADKAEKIMLRIDPAPQSVKAVTKELTIEPVLASASKKPATITVKLLPTKAEPESVTIVEKSAAVDTVYNAVEKNAQFAGGIQAFYQFLAKNIKYPAEAKNAKQQGKVFLNFIVEKDGALSNIKVLKSVSPEIDAEAVRVMSTSPKWIPATQTGKPVRQQYTVPINFSLAAK